MLPVQLPIQQAQLGPERPAGYAGSLRDSAEWANEYLRGSLHVGRWGP